MLGVNRDEASAQHVASRFHLDPVQWYARIEPLDVLPQLATAVWRDRRIRIHYESWKDVVTREADPYIERSFNDAAMTCRNRFRRLRIVPACLLAFARLTSTV